MDSSPLNPPTSFSLPAEPDIFCEQESQRAQDTTGESEPPWAEGEWGRFDEKGEWVPREVGTCCGFPISQLPVPKSPLHTENALTFMTHMRRKRLPSQDTDVVEPSPMRSEERGPSDTDFVHPE